MLSDQEIKIRDAVGCPRCTAAPGELCFAREGYHLVGLHWPERYELYWATERGEPYASAHCPVCGIDEPHAHADNELGTIEVKFPALFVQHFLGHGEISPTGLRLARLRHFMWRAAVEARCKTPQADAIKAAVVDERERCLAWVNHSILDGLRSGAVAPGAVK